MLFVLFRRGVRWRLARPDPPRPGAVRAYVTLPPRTLDHVRCGRRRRAVRVERAPYSLIVEPANSISSARPACDGVPSRPLRPLRPLSIFVVSGTFRRTGRASGLLRSANPASSR